MSRRQQGSRGGNPSGGFRSGLEVPLLGCGLVAVFVLGVLMSSHVHVLDGLKPRADAIGFNTFGGDPSAISVEVSDQSFGCLREEPTIVAVMAVQEYVKARKHLVMLLRRHLPDADSQAELLEDESMSMLLGRLGQLLELVTGSRAGEIREDRKGEHISRGALTSPKESCPEGCTDE